MARELELKELKQCKDSRNLMRRRTGAGRVNKTTTSVATVRIYNEAFV